MIRLHAIFLALEKEKEKESSQHSQSWARAKDSYSILVFIIRIILLLLTSLHRQYMFGKLRFHGDCVEMCSAQKNSSNAKIKACIHCIRLFF